MAAATEVMAALVEALAACYRISGICYVTMADNIELHVAAVSS
jgi:hypothetical protein